MSKAFLDIEIGDTEAYTAQLQAFEATQRFFDANKTQFGLEHENLESLDADAQELVTESFKNRNSGQGELVFKRPQPLRAGRLVIDLHTKDAPKAAENFRCLCTGEKGKGKQSGKLLHYKGIAFHRIVSGFVCQGGDVVKGDGSGGDSIYGGRFNDEKAALKLKHDAAGVVSMANSGKNSNTSQFFITLAAAKQCDGKHVVFGKVSEGLEVLQRIESEAASPDGQPRIEVRIADCGVV